MRAQRRPSAVLLPSAAATHPLLPPRPLQMYTTSLPLYYELVISSDEGAEGALDSGELAPRRPRLLLPRAMPACLLGPDSVLSLRGHADGWPQALRSGLSAAVTWTTGS